MKKLTFIILLMLVTYALAGCTVDENTHVEMQQYYDDCHAIPSCEAKLSELREQELSESELIQQILASIAEHEQRITDLEYRVERLEALTEGVSDTYTYITELEYSQMLSVTDEVTETDKIVVISFELQAKIDDGYSVEELINNLKSTLKTDLANVINPETITIKFVDETNTQVINLQDLLTETP